MRLPVVAYDLASRRRVLGSQRTFWNMRESTGKQSVTPSPAPQLDRQTRLPSDKDEARKGADFLRSLMDAGMGGAGADASKLPINMIIHGGQTNYAAELIFLGPLPDTIAQKYYDEWRRMNKQPKAQLWLLHASLQQRTRLASMLVDALPRVTPSALRSMASTPAIIGLPLAILGSADGFAASGKSSKEELLLLEHFKSVALTLIRCGDLQDLVLSTCIEPRNVSLFKRFLCTIRYPDALALCLELFSVGPSYSGTVAPITTIRNVLLKEKVLDIIMSFIYSKVHELDHNLMFAGIELLMSILITAPQPLQKSIALALIPDVLKFTFDASTITGANTSPAHSLRLKYAGLIAVVCFSIILFEAESNPSLVATELSSRRQPGSNLELDSKPRSRNDKATPLGSGSDDKDRPLNIYFQCYLDAVVSFANIIAASVRSGSGSGSGSSSVSLHLLSTTKTFALFLTLRSTPINTNDSFYGVTGSNIAEHNPNKLLGIFLAGSVNPSITGYTIPSRFASDKVVTRNFMTKMCLELERTGTYRNLMTLVYSNPQNSILHSSIAQIFLNTAVLGYYTPLLFKFLLQSSKLSDILGNLAYVPVSCRTSLDCFCKGVTQGLIFISTGVNEAHVLSKRLTNLPLLQGIYQADTNVVFATTANDLSHFFKTGPADTRVQLAELLIKDPGVMAYSKGVLEQCAMQPVAYDFNHKRFLQKLMSYRTTVAANNASADPSPQAGGPAPVRQETGSERAKNWRASTPLPKRRDVKPRRNSTSQTPPAMTAGTTSGAGIGSGPAIAPPASSLSRPSLRQQYEKGDLSRGAQSGTSSPAMPNAQQSSMSAPPTVGNGGPSSSLSKQQSMVSALSLDYNQRISNPQNCSPLERCYADKPTSALHHVSSIDRLPDRSFDTTIKERRASLYASPRSEYTRRNSQSSLQMASGASSMSAYKPSNLGRQPGGYSQSAYNTGGSYATPDSFGYSVSSRMDRQSIGHVESPYPDRGSFAGNDTPSMSSLRGYTDRSTERMDIK